MFEEISAQEFTERCAMGERWQLVDVREAWEIQIASLCGALEIPMADVPMRLAGLDASVPTAVICHSGGRSKRVALFLLQQGFSRVANISGGIESWSLTVDPGVPRY
jgi:rhodanese-related sulfurtransferase